MNFNHYNYKKVSVIIPTLLKNNNVLVNLIKTLILDETVEEIIIINNSNKKFRFNNAKVRIINPSTNLYVNPSWNLGVKEAKTQIVALFNDDLAIPENFCRDIVVQMKPDMGVIGLNTGEYMLCMDEIRHNPQNTNPIVEKAKYRDSYFGSAMFLYKQNYIPIPENIKIVYGDDWIAYCCKNSLYKISNQVIFHIGSLSSSDKQYSPICKNDAKIYKKITIKWYNRLFTYERIWDGIKIRILGITLKFINKKGFGIRNG